LFLIPPARATRAKKRSQLWRKRAGVACGMQKFDGSAPPRLE
jgi:hypothetical protein